MERGDLPDCFAFGDVCAADENAWFVPWVGLVSSTQGLGQGGASAKASSQRRSALSIFSRFSRSFF